MSEVDDSQCPSGWKAAQGMVFKKWCGWRGSNPRPLARSQVLYPAELQLYKVLLQQLENASGCNSMRLQKFAVISEY